MNNKQSLLNHFRELNKWVAELETVKPSIFFEPIASGKWSIAAIVAHFMIWDQFMEEERLNHFAPGIELPSVKVDVEAMNKQAKDLAENLAQAEIISNTIEARKSILAKLEDISEADFHKAFYINGKELTLLNYIGGLVEHDQHHQKQIQEKLNEQL